MMNNISRREWVQTLCGGLGSIGLAGMLSQQQAQAAIPGHYTGPHMPAKAKHVIFLFMTGGPSQLDMFDPKPLLFKHQGERPTAVNLRTERVTGGLMPSPFEFKKYGKNGTDVSELLPRIASVIDDICVIKSMYTLNPTHGPARNLIHAGTVLATRPCVGSWVSYGLGTENENLPSFVVLAPNPDGGSLWRSGFLPTEHQGVPFNVAEAKPEKMIRYLQNAELDPAGQRRQLDAIQKINQKHLSSFGQDAFLEGRIKAMESAYRMQSEAREAFDVEKEPESVRAEYGTTPFANSCLLARRLVERGVRYTHVYYGEGQVWDDHKDISKKLRERCPDMDQASAALIRDLKRRGLLDETLVVWGGEFGRTPVSESGDGRDHDFYGFTMWMAGGGVKGGSSYGATDEFGFKAVENRVSIHDLHATILYLLGIDHEKLTYPYAGRNFRLTDVEGTVVRDIIA